jgi:hypothetical protein
MREAPTVSSTVAAPDCYRTTPGGVPLPGRYLRQLPLVPQARLASDGSAWPLQMECAPRRRLQLPPIGRLAASMAQRQLPATPPDTTHRLEVL